MCDQQRLRQACANAQTDQSLCKSLEYSMSVKLLTEQHLEFLSLTGGCTGSSESTLVKMPHCWKLHVTAHLCVISAEVKKIKVEKEEKKQDNNVDKESERVQKILDTAMQILDIPQQNAINEDQQNTADKESDIRTNQMRRGTLGPPEITESNMLADDTDDYDDTEIFNPELLVSLQKDYDKEMEADKADRENKDRPNKSGPLIVKEELAEGDTAENASADKVKDSINRLFTYCKDGNFNIHIWAWFGYFIC